MDNIKELSKPVGFVGLRNIISLAEGNLGVISPNAVFGEEPVYSQEYVNSLIGQIEAAKKERDDLLNQEFQQRLANAEHQLYMKDLAIYNIKASRKAQFRKRLAAEAALSAANERVSREYPATLPCPVLLEPGLRLGKGLPIAMLFRALSRRADYEAEIDAMTPEQRAEHDQRMREGKKFISECIAPRPAGFTVEGGEL